MGKAAKGGKKLPSAPLADNKKKAKKKLESYKLSITTILYSIDDQGSRRGNRFDTHCDSSDLFRL